jgi:hypothetical protein
VAASYSGVVDLAVEAEKIADYAEEHPGVLISRRFVLRWLERERRERPVPVRSGGRPPPPQASLAPPALPVIGPESDAARERVKAALAARGLLRGYTQIGAPDMRATSPPPARP